MKVILKKQIEKLGSPGDIVDVRQGYGRNFLIPRELALPATEVNVKKVQEEKSRGIAVKEKGKKDAETLAGKLSAVSLTIQVAVGEDEKLFGSVTSINIANALGEEGIEIDRHNILLAEPIKKLGVYDVQVKIDSEITTTVKIWVVKK